MNADPSLPLQGEDDLALARRAAAGVTSQIMVNSNTIQVV
jgi:hypothetical protein